MKNSKTTKEIYEKLIQMPDLHSTPELDGEILIWKLYENAYVRAYCDSYDTCIDIISNSILIGSLTQGNALIPASFAKRWIANAVG